MRLLKAAVLGLAIVGFTGAGASACGWGKKKQSAQTTKPDTKQSTKVTTTKTTTVSSDTKK